MDPKSSRLAAKPKHEEINMGQSVARDDVFAAINSERDYQDQKWGDTLSGGRPGDGSRTVDEFSLYIIGYANDLLVHASHFGNEKEKLDIIRKIGGLSTACMEQHGAPHRS
jgi:hypothetical protein